MQMQLLLQSAQKWHHTHLVYQSKLNHVCVSNVLGIHALLDFLKISFKALCMLVVPVVRGGGQGLPEGITWKFLPLTHVCSPGTIQKLHVTFKWHGWVVFVFSPGEVSKNQQWLGASTEAEEGSLPLLAMQGVVFETTWAMASFQVPCMPTLPVGWFLRGRETRSHSKSPSSTEDAPAGVERMPPALSRPASLLTWGSPAHHPLTAEQQASLCSADKAAFLVHWDIRLLERYQ